MEPVAIGHAGKTLVFYDPEFEAAVPAYISVKVTSPDLTASHRVYAGWGDGFRDLAAFFTDLAEHWRGWQGERLYESIEGDLRIQAVHDGHVRLHVVLWQSSPEDGWRVEAEVQLDAGEALSKAAEDLAALVRAG